MPKVLEFFTPNSKQKKWGGSLSKSSCSNSTSFFEGKKTSDIDVYTPPCFEYEIGRVYYAQEGEIQNGVLSTAKCLDEMILYDFIPSFECLGGMSDT